jgi:hypothetical protein
MTKRKVTQLFTAIVLAASAPAAAAVPVMKPRNTNRDA